jgi:multicomponent Na+:H+ antiporter subunit D
VTGGWLLAAIVLSSAVPGAIIFALAERQQTARTALNLAGAVAKLVFVAIMLAGIARAEVYELRFTLLPGWDFYLAGDALAMLFVTLSAGLWLVTTLYAIGYLEGQVNRSRFFGFFSLCVSATTGIAFASNLLTFLFFYETLTLATYPLVVHHGDRASLRAGRIYLAYTLGGGAVLVFAAGWLHALVGAFPFIPGGALAALQVDGARPSLAVIFALLVIGLGVKSALVPLHAWLPAAMVAPAPVSALLHAVAVVKAGAFGIVRVIYEVFGVNLCRELGVLRPLSVAAAGTILYGSLRALQQVELKKLLAYSTVSQLAYIALGVSIPGELATTGGLVHLVHQGLMKITMFFCAGVYSHALGIHLIRDLAGIGRRMPVTTALFTVAALAMIGLPPLAGFVSKWLLGVGAATGGEPWVIGVLVASTLLNAAYFLPIVYAAWFRDRREPWPVPRHAGRWEASPLLLVPPLVTAALTIVVGVLAGAPFSVQTWAEIVVEREYER